MVPEKSSDGNPGKIPTPIYIREGGNCSWRHSGLAPPHFQSGTEGPGAHQN